MCACVGFGSGKQALPRQSGIFLWMPVCVLACLCVQGDGLCSSSLHGFDDGRRRNVVLCGGCGRSCCGTRREKRCTTRAVKAQPNEDKDTLSTYTFFLLSLTWACDGDAVVQAPFGEWVVMVDTTFSHAPHHTAAGVCLLLFLRVHKSRRSIEGQGLPPS